MPVRADTGTQRGKTAVSCLNAVLDQPPDTALAEHLAVPAGAAPVCRIVCGPGMVLFHLGTCNSKVQCAACIRYQLTMEVYNIMHQGAWAKRGAQRDVVAAAPAAARWFLLCGA